MKCTFSINQDPSDTVGEIFIHTGIGHILVFESLAEIERFAENLGRCVSEIRENYPGVTPN